MLKKEGRGGAGEDEEENLDSVYKPNVAKPFMAADAHKRTEIAKVR